MFPTSSLAKPIFYSIWSLVAAGAILASPAAPLPYRPVWKEYARRVLPTVMKIRDELSRCGFTLSIAESLLDDWNQRDSNQFPVDQTELDVSVAVDAGRFPGPLPKDGAERSAMLDEAIRHQLARLLDRLMLTQCAAELEGVHFDATVYESLLSLAHSLVGSSSPFAGQDAKGLMKSVVSEWRRRATTFERETSRGPEVNDWLEACVGRVQIGASSSPT